MSQAHDQYSDGESNYRSKSPLKALIARVVTLISVIVSIAVLKTNDVTFDGGYVLTYKNFRSYTYMFYVMIIGVGYTLLQIPFAIYYMRTKKHLINHFVVLKFDFYADKVMVFLLATGVGAGFGVTMDMKKYTGENLSKIQNFLTIAYVPPSFLLIGCLTSGFSSVHSSLALSKN